jgi:hypothetical protein
MTEMQYEQGNHDMFIEFSLESFLDKSHLEKTGTDERLILKCMKI